MGKMKLAAAALTLAIAAAPAFAQQNPPRSGSLSLTKSVNSVRLSERADPRVDPLLFNEKSSVRAFELPGIPFISTGRAGKRERGFSLSVRPVKGLKATARLRF